MSSNGSQEISAEKNKQVCSIKQQEADENANEEVPVLLFDIPVEDAPFDMPQDGYNTSTPLIVAVGAQEVGSDGDFEISLGILPDQKAADQ